MTKSIIPDFGTDYWQDRAHEFSIMNIALNTSDEGSTTNPTAVGEVTDHYQSTAVGEVTDGYQSTAVGEVTLNPTDVANTKNDTTAEKNENDESDDENSIKVITLQRSLSEPMIVSEERKAEREKLRWEHRQLVKSGTFTGSLDDLVDNYNNVIAGLLVYDEA